MKSPFTTSVFSLVISLIISLVALGANARPSDSGEEFRRSVLSAQSQCPLVSCSNTSIQMKTLTAAEIHNLTDETRDRLEVTANEMSQIWGDTILEGDYYSDAEVQVDQIQELTIGPTMIGYRITYSAVAWDTSTCDFQSEDKSTLKKCQSGKIMESGFVSADFSSSFQDSFAPAIFAD